MTYNKDEQKNETTEEDVLKAWTIAAEAKYNVNDAVFVAPEIIKDCTRKECIDSIHRLSKKLIPIETTWHNLFDEENNQPYGLDNPFQRRKNNITKTQIAACSGIYNLSMNNIKKDIKRYNKLLLTIATEDESADTMKDE